MARAPKTKIKSEYREKHHIKPKCLCDDVECPGYKTNHKHTCGIDDPENLAWLTPEEHYVAHQLLMKIYPKNRSLIFATKMMTIKCPNHQRGNKLYGWLKREISQATSGTGNPMFGVRLTGENNHFYGKHHSDVTKAVLRSKCPNYGETNGFYGKHHSDVTKAVLRAKRNLRITVHMNEGSVQQFNSIKMFAIWFSGVMGVSRSLGEKLCNPNNEHLLGKYGIKEVIKHYEAYKHQTS